MTERFQNNDNNTDNQNTLNIPVQPKRPNYRQPQQKNPNTRRPIRPLNQQQNNNYNRNPNQNYSSSNYQQQYSQNSNYQNPNYQYQNSNYQRQSQNYQQPYYQNPNYQNPNYQYQNSNYQRQSQNYQQPHYQNPNYQQNSYSNYTQAPSKHRKKRKHKSLFGRVLKRILLSLFTILVLLFAIYSCTAFSIIGKIGKQDSTGRNRTVGAMSRNYVRSVLVIGTDGRSIDEQGRSDSMILVSFNSRTNQIILTSFMRDCYVNIPNYGMDKLNASYSYGGADLLMDTIESNFMVEIDDYVIVDFISFVGIIDAVGGIDIDVTDDEAQEINNILFSEVNGLMGDDQWSDFLDGGGKLHLNGKQALSYARIRYVGNSDFERTSRQRKVITKVIPKALNPVAISKISKHVIPEVNTNMSSIGMYLLALRLPLSIRYDVKQIQIPADGTFYPEDVWTASGDIQNVLQVDFSANQNVLETEVFGH